MVNTTINTLPVGHFVSNQDSKSKLIQRCFLVVRLWDVATGKVRRKFGGSPGGYYQVAFCRDGRTLVSAGEDGQVRIWETATGKLRRQLTGHLGPVLSIVLADDERTVFSSSADSTVIIWDASGLRRRRPGLPVALEKRFHEFWTQLASDDAMAAHLALWELASAGDPAIVLLGEKLRPAGRIDSARIQGLIAELDNKLFSVREKAERELTNLGQRAEAALRRVLADNPSLETRTRINKLLSQLAKGPSPKRIREIRAIEVLENLSTPRALRLLSRLSKGAPRAALTQDAQTAIARIKR